MALPAIRWHRQSPIRIISIRSGRHPDPTTSNLHLSYLPTAWHWDFGDGTMSQDTNPVHTYTEPGAYNVCLIASNVYAADTFCRQVIVGTSGLHELPAMPQAQVLPNPFARSGAVARAGGGGAAVCVIRSVWASGCPGLARAILRPLFSLPGLPAGCTFGSCSGKGYRRSRGRW